MHRRFVLKGFVHSDAPRRSLRGEWITVHTERLWAPAQAILQSCFIMFGSSALPQAQKGEGREPKSWGAGAGAPSAVVVCLQVPILHAYLKEGAKILGVEIDYRHSPLMKAQEDGDTVFGEKRLMQLNLLVPALKKEWLG